MHRTPTSAPHARAGPLAPAMDGLRAWALAFLAAALWFEVLWRAAPGTLAQSAPPALAAAVGLAAQLAFTAVEASLGVAAWGALGFRVRWSALAPALLTVSTVEAIAVAVASGATGLHEGWSTILAGPRAASGAGADALARAFASFGVLTLLRLALAAHAHAAAARVPWWRAAALVLVFHLASRLLVWWSLDLMQGRSYEPWGHVPPCPDAGTA